MRNKELDPNIRSDDVPVTKKMLMEVRSELITKFTSLELKLNSRDHDKQCIDMKVDSIELKLDSLDKKVDSLDTKVNSLDKKVDSLDKKVDSLESKMISGFEKVASEIHYAKILAEEQNSRNIYVLDALKLAIDKLQNHDERLFILEAR